MVPFFLLQTLSKPEINADLNDYTKTNAFHSPSSLSESSAYNLQFRQLPNIKNKVALAWAEMRY